MIIFRSCDSRYPFLWESTDQPAARWHAYGEGPVHYFADTPWGAWAEFLRHEEITDAEDLEGIQRDIWAAEIKDMPADTPALGHDVLTGGGSSYRACQAEARRQRLAGSSGIVAQSAALGDGQAAGWVVNNGLHRAEPRDPKVVVLFGPRPDVEGWPIVDGGRPSPDILPHVLHL